MKKIILLLLFSPVTVLAQMWPWGVRGGGFDSNSTNIETVLSLVTDSQKNVYAMCRMGYSGVTIAGQSIPSLGDPGTKEDLLLVALDCSGNLRWTKTIGGGGVEFVGKLAVDTQDNIYVAVTVTSCVPAVGDPNYPGYFGSYSFDNTYEACNTNALVKLDTNGNMLWIQRPQPDVDDTLSVQSATFGLIRSDDGILHWLMRLPEGVYANGQYTVPPSSNKWHILKYDDNGNFISGMPLDIFVEVVPGVQFYRNPYNGHYFFCEYRDLENPVSFGGNAITGSSFLASYDAAGNFLWVRESTEGQVGCVYFHGLDFDSQNNIYIGGVLTNTIGNASFIGFTIPPTEFQRTFVMKTNPTAENVIWAHYSNRFGDLRAVCKMFNNELYWAGHGGGTVNWSGQSFQVATSNNGNRHFAAKFNKDTGACTGGFWIPSPQGGANYFTAMAQDASGDMILGGEFTGTIVVNNNVGIASVGGLSDFIIAKYANQACSPLSLDELPFEQAQLYPNPVTDELAVTVKQTALYKIVNSNGAVIQEGTVSEEAAKINVSKLPTGVYLLQLSYTTGERETKKVVKK